MADEKINKDKQSQRSNQQDWSSDPNYVPGQQAGNPNPGESDDDKTDPMRRSSRDIGTRTRPEDYKAGGSGGSQTPNQGSNPGNPNPRRSDVEDDEAIGEPNTGDDDTMKKGGMGRDRDTDPGKGGQTGGMGGSGHENR